MAGLFADLSTPFPGRGSIGRNFLESDPNAAYQALMNQMGLSFQQNPFAEWARKQSGQTYDLYKAALSTRNPAEFDYVDFLEGHGPKLSGLWSGLTPQQRGERYGGGLGKMRYVGFPS